MNINILQIIQDLSGFLNSSNIEEFAQIIENLVSFVKKIEQDISKK